MDYCPNCSYCYKPTRRVVYTTFEYFYCDECKLEVSNYGIPIRIYTPSPLEKHEELLSAGWKYEYDGFNRTEKYFHPNTGKHYSFEEAYDELKGK